MQDTLVSARMPVAKKDRAKGVLASIGATTSDLINSAFDYVIATKQLPVASPLVQADRGDFAEFVAGTSFEVDWPEGADECEYKDMAGRMRLADYESLA